MDRSFCHRSVAALSMSLMLCAVNGMLQAQELIWSTNYGGCYNEGAYSGVVTADGGYVVLGSTYSYGAGDHDIYVLRLDSLGDTLWSNTFGGASADYGYDIQETADGNFILIGATNSFGSGKGDIYLLKIDFMGRLLWARTYGGPEPERGLSVRITPDSGYIIAGFTYSYGSGAGDVYLVRTDARGDSLWSRTFGGASDELGYAVRTVHDSGYIVCGYTQSFGQGFSSMYVIRTDASGDSLWTHTYGGDKADMGYTVEVTLDGGFILAGATASYGLGYSDCYLVKTDAAGSLEWEQTYGGVRDDRAYSVRPGPDGGYLVAGTTESFGSGQIDVYIIKTDPFGFADWQQTFGGAKSDFCRMAISDRQAYVLIGHSYSYGTGGSDVYLLKIHGRNATAVDDDISPLLPDGILLAQNYPNPFNLATTIEFTLQKRDDISLTVYNLLGQTVRVWQPGSMPAGDHTITWDGYTGHGHELASGVYFYSLQTATQRQTRKMLLLK